MSRGTLPTKEWEVASRFGDFLIHRVIAEGSCGRIYLGSRESDGREVAVKVEPAVNALLLAEAAIMREFPPDAGWFFKMHDSGVDGDFVYLVTDLGGPNLEELYHFCLSSFSLKTVLMIADQMGEHIPYREGKSFVGTARWASVNAHLGIETSRRDDLQSLGYVLIFLLKGGLPWQGLRADSTITLTKAIADIKLRIPARDLCVGLPDEFVEYFDYVQRLDFAEDPDYSHLRNLFRDLYDLQDYPRDGVFDWMRPVTIQPSTPPSPLTLSH